ATPMLFESAVLDIKSMGVATGHRSGGILEGEEAQAIQSCRPDGSTYGSRWRQFGRSLCSCSDVCDVLVKQFPQHILKDATMMVVGGFCRCINTDFRIECLTIALRIRRPYMH